MAEIFTIIGAWVKGNLGLIFSGSAGAIIGAILFKGTIREKFMCFVVGAMMSQCLGEPASQIFYNGQYAGLFGFAIGLSGMTLARIIQNATEKHSRIKLGIEDDKKEGN